MPSLTPVPSDKRWPSKPIFCLSPTTFWSTFPSTKTAAEVEPSAEVLIPRMVPHLVPLLVPDKHLKTHEQDHEHHQQCGRGKKRFVAGSDPLFLALLSRQNPFGLRGSLPATVCAPCTRTSQLSCVRSAEGSCPSRSTVLTCTTP